MVQTVKNAGQVRLLPFIFLGTAAVIALYSGSATLIALQVEQFDPVNKVANLGLITGISSVFATVFNPIGGALSDRTRSRFGRRNPWLLGGAAAGLGTMLFLGMADNLLMLGIGWCLAQGVYNLYQAALLAIIPDRVTNERRGTASAVMGIGLPVGGVVGAVTAANFATDTSYGYLIFGGAVVAAAVLLVFFTRDPRPGEYQVSEPSGLVQSFLFALRHRDFLLVFVGRAMMILGYFMVLGFMLYILKDHIGLPSGLHPAAAVAQITMISTVCSVLATIIGGPLSDRLDRRKAFVVISGVIAALALVIPLVAPSWPMMQVYAAVHGFAFGIYGAVDLAIATLVLPSQGDAARDMGVLNIAGAGPQIAAPFVASVIINALGGYPALFAVATVVCLIGALALIPVKGVR